MAGQQAQQTKWNKLVEIISNLNIYDSATTDPILLHREVLSTRLFIVLFIVSLCTISIYASASLQQKTEQVLFPTENQYRTILRTYPITVACPCSTTSIPFNEFALISPIFHQVCESDFISQGWIDFILHPNRSAFWPMDTRNSLSALWQIIRVFCTESRVTFDTSLQDFQDSSLITSMILSPELLETALKVSANKLQQVAIDSLLRSAKAIHILTRARDFVTGISTNFITLGRLASNLTFIEPATTRTVAYKNVGASKLCYCQNDESCPIPAGIYLYDTWETLGIYDFNQIVPTQIIPGLVLDCLPIQTVLGSTLECFYNQTCLSIVTAAYPQQYNISNLDINIASQFRPVDRIEKLIEAIFIEDVVSQTNFTSYYLKCQPPYCIYTYTRRFDWSYVLTTVIGLFSGLNIVLQLICPYIIQFIFWLKERINSNDTQVQVPTTSFSLKTMLIRLISLIVETIVNLNLFTKKSTRQIQLRRGRIATRLYLVLFSVILAGLTLYTAVSVRSITQIIRSPSESQFKYLQERYPTTLQCPCSVVSISYNDFIEIHPSLHQVCFSNFVKKSWYQQLGMIELLHLDRNYTYSLAWYFRSVATLCDLSGLLLDQSIRRFNSTEYVSAKVPEVNTFESQMESIISGFKITTKNDFNYTMELIKAIFQANQYISGIPLQGAFLFVANLAWQPELELLTTKIVAIDRIRFLPAAIHCFCTRQDDCYERLIWRYDHAATCSTLQSTLKLTLEDLYQTDFVTSLEQFINQENIGFLRNTSILNPTEPTRFEINTTLEEIFEELMVEDWNAQANFSRFYEICHPESCSYSYDERPSLVLLISIISGVVGGLNMILRLICPIFIRILIGDPHTNSTNSSTNIDQDQFDFVGYLTPILRSLREAIISLNLFDDKPKIINTKKKEVASTWLYLSLLLSAMIVAAVYVSLISYSSNAVVRLYSLSKYEKLLGLGLNSFRCPCTEISVPYKDFILIDATFHQVCDSDFVKTPWIYALFEDGWWAFYQTTDIRIRGAAYFGLLASLCQLSKRATRNALNLFLDETFVSTHMLPKSEFYSRVGASIDLFERNIPAQYATVLRVLNQLTHASTFVSAYMLNWEWQGPVHETFHRLKTRPVVNDIGCSCGTRNDCRRSADIFDFYKNSTMWILPSFFVGCSSVSTLLQSTLECFFNQTCIDSLITNSREHPISINMSVEVTPLNSELDSIYETNTPIQRMVELLFVEKWQKSVSYTAFYEKCAPVQCSYSYEKRNDILYIITTILSIYGGAAAILRLIIPYFVSLLIYITHHRMPTITPST